jgi:hypothetical protein
LLTLNVTFSRVTYRNTFIQISIPLRLDQNDSMAAVELKGVVQFRQPLGGLSVPAILDPSVGLHEDGRTKVGVGVPPVGRTRRGAARTENALVHV